MLWLAHLDNLDGAIVLAPAAADATAGVDAGAVGVEPDRVCRAYALAGPAEDTTAANLVEGLVHAAIINKLTLLRIWKNNWFAE